MDVFEPIVRGVVEKTKNVFHADQFMWSKDLNEAAVNVEKQYEPRVTELVDAQRAHLCEPFHRAGIEAKS